MRPNPLPALTLPQMLLHHAQVRPAAPALRQRDRRTGAWRSLTWRDYFEQAADIAGGMQALGFGPGTHVAVLAENRIEWVLTQMAASMIGAVTVGIYPTSSADEIAYAVGHADIGLAVLENAAQLAKLRGVASLPSVLAVIEPIGEASHGLAVRDFRDLQTLGQEWRRAHPGTLEEALAAQGLDALALMIFTSGSTGQPKGALLSFRNVHAAAFGLVDGLHFGPDSEILSYLPLCHVAEQAMSVFGPLYGGACVAFGGGIPTLLEDLRTIRPTYFSGVPRIWEKLQAVLLPEFAPGGRFSDPSGLAALELGRSLAFLSAAEWSPEQRRQAADCEARVWHPARSLLGLERLQVTTSGAASLVPDVVTFFRALAVPLIELYGMTEACSMLTLQQSRVIPGTVGEPVGAVELRLAEDGEILVRGDNVFVTYYQNPDATAAAKRGGWLHTGDLGSLVDGQLRIIGRKKDIIITSGGKNVAATEIETLMKSSALIEECIILGEGRNFVAALIQLSVPDDELAAAVEVPGIERRVAAEIARLNTGLARVYQVRRAYLLPRKLAYGAGELTATLKIRRFAIYQSHSAEIDAIYAGRIGFDVTAQDQ